MGTIVNPEYVERTVYNDEKFSESQMLTDASTMSSSDEEIFKQLASTASDYGKRVLRKKHYDFKTKNKSFLRLYDDLYTLGVKNNKFFLRIVDTDLIGMDPYSPILPKDIQVKMFIECLINPWYFLREVLRIPTDGLPIEVGGGSPYLIDRNNAAAWYLFLNGIDHYQSKPRQTGKTQDAVAKFNYAYHFGAIASTMLFFNKDQEQANMNLYRLKCQRDMLPTWLQMRTVVDSEGKVDRGTDNTKSIRNPVNGNIIKTMGKATSKETAMKLGRGATAALQYYDEFDFTPYQTEIMNAAAYAYSTAAQNAERNGSLFGRILTSTPGDLDTRDGEEATKYVDRMLIWEDKMFDTPIDQLKKIIKSPSYNRFVFIEHSWKQLKKSVEWYERACGLVNYNMEVILREIELKRIHGSNNSPFKQSDLMYLMNNQMSPYESIDLSKNLCYFHIFVKLRKNKVYIVSVDPSEGLAQDNNAVTVIDPANQHPVAEFKSPYISQTDLGDLLIEFMDRYCPRSMIVVENNKGRELINYLLKSRYRYQVYYDDGKLNNIVIDKTDKHGALKREAMTRRAYGVTTGRNRSQYYAILENIMEERKNILTLPYLVKDICGLIRKPNSRVEAGPGQHDDNIMSYLIGLYVYYNAKAEHLETFGIRRGLSDDSDDYNEDGTLSEEGSLKKLASMLDVLPENLRVMVQERMAEFNRGKNESEMYHRQMEMSAMPDLPSIEMNRPPMSEEESEILVSNAPRDQEFWKEYDNKIWESNNYGYNEYGFNNDIPNPTYTDFDIEDYLT